MVLSDNPLHVWYWQKVFVAQGRLSGTSCLARDVIDMMVSEWENCAAGLHSILGLPCASLQHNVCYISFIWDWLSLWCDVDKTVPDGKIAARGLPLGEAVEEIMDEVLLLDVVKKSIAGSFLVACQDFMIQVFASW